VLFLDVASVEVYWSRSSGFDALSGGRVPLNGMSVASVPESGYIVGTVADLLGAFEQAVLVAIVRLGPDAYGRGVHAAVQERLERTIAPGAIHATLDRLERKGFVRSRLGDGTPARDGRPRRYYALTSAGAEALNNALHGLEHIWSGVKWPLKARSLT
jgi:DNA-binding PadR family transcriptional regulator